MKTMPRIKNNGSALPLVLVAVIFLLTIGTALLTLGLNGRIYSIFNTAEITARCAADAGLTKALFDMNQKILVSPWNDSILPFGKQISLNNCDATYSYIVTTNAAGEYVITSIGRSRNATKTIQATLGLKGIFDHAILTKQSLTLKSGTIIDGYNSNNPADTDVYVKIGTQSTASSQITLNNSVVVGGDVFVGKGGNPETVIKDLGATVDGDQRAATKTELLPQITAPASLANKGSVTVSKKTGSVTFNAANSGVYSNIDLQQNNLIIDSGNVVLHVTNNLTLGEGCEIVVKTGATLTLYMDGNIVSGNNSSISSELPPEEAETIKIYATGTGTQTLDVKAKSDWTGVIYAPNSNVILYANGDAYGSIVANNFEFKNGGSFHYDEALREAAIGQLGTRFTISRWHDTPVDTTSANQLYALLAH
jgi:hypothetical protein